MCNNRIRSYTYIIGFLTSKNRSTEGCSKLKSPETRQVQEINDKTIKIFVSQKNLVDIPVETICLCCVSCQNAIFSIECWKTKSNNNMNTQFWLFLQLLVQYEENFFADKPMCPIKFIIDISRFWIMLNR